MLRDTEEVRLHLLCALISRGMMPQNADGMKATKQLLDQLTQLVMTPLVSQLPATHPPEKPPAPTASPV